MDTELPRSDFAVYCCPFCGSDSTGKYSAIHEKGIAHIESSGRHVGVGLAGDSMVGMVGRSDTSGVQQSELSRKTAPPPKREVFGVGRLIVAMGCAVPLLGFVGAFVILFVLFFAIGEDVAQDLGSWVLGLSMILSAVLVWFGFRASAPDKLWNETEHPKLHAEWSRKWLCMRCGESFVPTDRGS